MNEKEKQTAHEKADNLVQQMHQLNDEIKKSIKELTKRGDQWNSDGNADEG